MTAELPAATLAHQDALDKLSQDPGIGVTSVRECQRRFKEVFAQDANKEKTAFARLFVEKIEFDPDPAEFVIYIRPSPGVASKQNTRPG